MESRFYEVSASFYSTVKNFRFEKFSFVYGPVRTQLCVSYVNAIS